MSAPWIAVAVAIALFLCAKAITWWRAEGFRAQAGRTASYVLLWSGMDARTFLHGGRARGPLDLRETLAATGCVAMGMVALAVASTLDRPWLAGGAGVLGFALLIHWGVLRVADVLWRAAGARVAPLMRGPLGSTSLAEFWARRWNTSYAALSAELAYSPLRRAVGRRPARLLTFLASGLVHELAITVPAGGGYGGPTAFFALHGCATELERSRAGRSLGLGSGWRGRAFTLATLALPLPLLFPLPFLERVVVPLAGLVAGWMVPSATTATLLLGTALWLAGVAHFCVLFAGVQVPHRFDWKHELARLSRFNRRIVWAYHAFMGLTIVAFGTLTLALHDEILAGDRAALGLVALMAAWWLLRLVVDALWYSHDDWPEGRRFVAGHALLVLAFVGMSGTYAGVLVAHWSGLLGA